MRQLCIDRGLGRFNENCPDLPENCRKASYIDLVNPDFSTLRCPICDENTCGNIFIETVHEISNNVASATSKASDQPVSTSSLLRAFASRLTIV